MLSPQIPLQGTTNASAARLPSTSSAKDGGQARSVQSRWDVRAETRHLRIGLDGPENVSLQLTGKALDAEGPAPLELASAPYEAAPPAYGEVLFDLLSGGSGLSVRGDEAEEAWRIVTPVLEAWADGRVPMAEYPAGSAGPAPLSPSQG